MSGVSRRTFLGSALAGPALTGPALAGPQDPPPNVLFLMTDQHRYDCLGANGNPIIRTPNLDRLAARSANFSAAFVQSPVCVPSRISYFTGRYPHSHKNRVNYTPADRREVLWPRRFHDAGYRTGSVGKLHLYPPTAEHARSEGFDRALMHDGVAKTDPYSDYVAWRRKADPNPNVPYNASTSNIPPGGNPFRGAVPEQFTPTAWTGMETRRMLREFASSPKPFFLFSSFFKPHAPFQVPPLYDSMYSGVDIPLPRRVSLDDIRQLPLPLQRLILRGRPEYETDPERLQWIYRSYYASVSQLDKEIGLILDELEKLGRARDTIVIFGTDHGCQLLEHGLMDKNVFFESSVRVPFLVHWPDRIRPGRYSELIEMVDVLPTALELCQIPIPANCQGRSFAGLIGAAAGAYRPREVAFSENIIPEVINSGSLDMPFEPGQGVAGIRHPDAKMARTRRWKLNYYPDYAGELYDLENDPGEERNLFDDPKHRSTVRELKDALLHWMVTADEVDQIAPRWLL